MATYAIGDIHGCLQEFQTLLKLIAFNPKIDRLWLVGDIVNRGPESLATLRLVRNMVLEGSTAMVLGNHDLHLVALQYHQHLLPQFPELAPIFAAPDAQVLLDWLRVQPLLIHDQTLGYTCVHAGLPPQWDLGLAKSCARELEQVLCSQKHSAFLQHMYGNKPDHWQEGLTGLERWRFITNCLTRLRFCDLEGRLNLTCKAKIGDQPPGYMPWFKVPERKSKNLKIIFGHWAALAGKSDEANTYALDTGCVWGGSLTAMRLEDEKKWAVGKIMVNG
jgi:bis(5'-nucleosyl)-tetraphosphatase (symmetrical)